MLPSLLYLLLSLQGATAQSLQKTPAYPSGLGSSFVFSSALPSRFSSYTTTLPSIPPQCQTYASNVNSAGALYCDPATGAEMQAANLTIQDCTQDPTQQETEAGFQIGIPAAGQTWTVCRCSDAPNTFDVLERQFSRLPVNLRDYVRYLVAFNGQESAFSENQDMVLFGDESTEQGLTVLIHEAHHDIDQGTSSSSAWLDAIDADSCVPDPYAATNAVEDFAQVGVVHLYLDIFGTPPGGVDLSCMKNQLSVFDSSSRINAAAMAVNAANSSGAAFPSCDMSVRGKFNNPPSRMRRARGRPPKPTSTVMPRP